LQLKPWFTAFYDFLFLWGVLWPNFLHEKATAAGCPLQYQLAVSAFFVFLWVLKSPIKTQKSTHRCAAIFVRIPRPGRVLAA
jgi:hypothetical protein